MEVLVIPIVCLRSARNEVSDEVQDKVAKSDFGGRFQSRKPPDDQLLSGSVERGIDGLKEKNVRGSVSGGLVVKRETDVNLLHYDLLEAHPAGNRLSELIRDL